MSINELVFVRFLKQYLTPSSHNEFHVSCKFIL